MLHTRSLLGAIASDGTDNLVLLAANAVLGALCVSLSLSLLVLGLALSMLLLARVCPGCGASGVTNGLDDVALGGVELAGSFTVTSGQREVLRGKGE